MSNSTVVIIGAGQAGAWAAWTLRNEGFDGRLVLAGEEPFPPYERPPLSKEVLLGQAPPESTYLWSEQELREQQIELELGTRANRVDRASRTVEFENGTSLNYDRLLLATGSRVRRLAVPGAELAGIHYLRQIPDTLAIRQGLDRQPRVVIVGGGWIGLEVASGALRLGAQVTLVECEPRLCARAVPPRLSTYLQDVHQSQGVDVRCGVSVESFEGDQQVERARLSDGTTLEIDMAVLGIGIIPNSELAQQAGLEVDNGILVDEFCRTSDPDILAAGDVTNHPNSLLGRRLRLESWQNAQNQAIAAAKSLLDRGEPYQEIPWFWSDQYDLNIQLVGLPEKWDTEVVRGDPASNRFTCFFLRDGRIEGAAGVNTGRDVRLAKRIMEKDIHVSSEDLADESLKLQKLLKRRS